MAIRIVTNVPAADVDERIQFYTDSGATSVTPAPKTDGEFTMIVVYPDYERFAGPAAGAPGTI